MDIVTKLYYFEMELTPSVKKCEGIMAVFHSLDLCSLFAVNSATAFDSIPASDTMEILLFGVALTC